jgi:hypothetical protein
MALTFINLCNKTLLRLNEVEIQAPDFPSTRGIQSLVKDAVRNAIATINQSQFEWPFNAAEESRDLTTGQTEYTYPSTFQSIDWNSFQIIPSVGEATRNSRLVYIDRDVWYENYRDADDDAGAAGIGIPRFVFRAHGNGFGVSPSPDLPYRIQFRYFLNFIPLENASDTTTIPDDFERVIVDGALYYMYTFKDNMDNASAAYDVFQQGMKSLRTIYINTYDSIRDTRINFGGGGLY